MGRYRCRFALRAHRSTVPSADISFVWRAGEAGRSYISLWTEDCPPTASLGVLYIGPSAVIWLTHSFTHPLTLHGIRFSTSMESKRNSHRTYSLHSFLHPLFDGGQDIRLFVL